MNKTITIAAVDSSKTIREQVDCVCDGTYDVLTSKKAVDELPHGGILHLHAGNYHINTYGVK